MVEFHARVHVEFNEWEAGEHLLAFYRDQVIFDINDLQTYAEWYVEQFNWRVNNVNGVLTYITLRDAEYRKLILYNMKDIKSITYLGLDLPGTSNE